MHEHIAHRWLLFAPTALLLASRLACSSSATDEQPPIQAMDASPPPQEVALEAGCTLIPLVPSSPTTVPTGCTIEWACSDGGLLTFSCEASGNAGQCACISDTNAFVVETPTNLCATPQDLDKSASTYCGWNVP